MGLAGEIKAHDVATGQELLTLPTSGLTVVSLAFSPDGRYLAAAGGTANKADLTLWDAGPAAVVRPAP
jgi:hypothetical protein